jgi:TolA-binding protein
MLDLIENKFSDAEEGLQGNRTALRAAATPDTALLEQTEFALAAVAFQRQTAVKEELREYTTAEERYRGALQQYPESAEAPKARFYLGQCHWFVAWQKCKALESGALTDEERKAYQKQYAESVRLAAEQFEKIESVLTAKQSAGPLSPEEETLLWRSAFSYAECAYFMSKFDEAIRRYSELATRYQGQIGELAALAQIFKCNLLSHDVDKAKAIFPKIRATYDKLPDSAFTGSERALQRSFWAKWLIDSEKYLEGPSKPSTGP